MLNILGPTLFVIFIAAIMISWRLRYDRTLCLFRTSNDFIMTGRSCDSTGIDYTLDDSEYADDTAVIFDSRDSLETFTPLLINHFKCFGMEVHVGDRIQPDKPSKTEILFVAATPKMYNDPITYDDTDLSPIELGNNMFLPVVDIFCYLGTVLTRDC